MIDSARLQEFHGDFFQEVVVTSDAERIYKEEALFEIYSDYLIDAGEIDNAIYAHYQPPRGGVRVDGYCGDPLEDAVAREANAGELKLIIVDFSPNSELSTITQTDATAAFKRALKFVSKARDIKFRSSMEETNPGYELADLIATRWTVISRIKIYLLTNRVLGKGVTGKEADEIEGIPVAYDLWDITRLFNLVQSGREREELVIDFNELPNGPLSTLLASAPGPGSSSVYLAAIPGADLAAIYDRWGNRLLEQNVRVFLQARSNVNKGIKRTLENEPELFFPFNNGLTATAERIETVETDEGTKIVRLENLQIVNGGQTTASVYSAYKNKVDLSRVFVQLKLCIVTPEKAQDLVPRISKSANSQNKVSEADFFSNHPFHIRIEGISRRMLAPAKEGSFLQTKWYYERARGQYRDEQAYLTASEKKKFAETCPKSQVFTKTDLAKYLMVWTPKAYFVNRGAQKNFAEFAKLVTEQWEKNELQFNEYYFRCLVAKKIVFNATERIVAEQDWYETGGYRSQHVALTLGYLSHSVEKLGCAVNFEEIWNKQQISPLLEQAIAQAAGLAHKVLMSPQAGYKNIGEWAKQERCLTTLCKAEVNWDPLWVKELLSKDEEREAKDDARKEQKEQNGIEAQEMVVSMGSSFWADVLAWGVANNELSDTEQSVMRVATKISLGKIPTDKQCLLLVRTMERLKGVGCPYKFKKGRPGRRRR